MIDSNAKILFVRVVSNVAIASAVLALLSGYMGFVFDAATVSLIQVVVAACFIGLLSAWSILQGNSLTLIVGCYVVGVSLSSLFPNLVAPIFQTSSTFVLEKWVRVSAIMMACCLLGTQCALMPDPTRFFRWIWPAGISLVAVGAVNGLGANGRLGNEAGNAIWFARLAGICVLCILLTCADYRSYLRFRRPLALGTCGILLALMLWSGSRGPVISLVAVVALVGIGWITKHFLQLIFCLFMAPIVAFASYQHASADVQRRFDQLLRSQITGDGPYNRSDLYRYAADMIVDCPLGHGFGYFLEMTGKSYPHNFFLESLIEPGVVFCLMTFPLIGLSIWYSLGSLIQRRDSYQYQKLPAALCLYSFLNSMFSGDLSSPKLLYIGTAYVIVERVLSSRSRESKPS